MRGKLGFFLGGFFLGGVFSKTIGKTPVYQKKGPGGKKGPEEKKGVQNCPDYRP